MLEVQRLESAYGRIKVLKGVDFRIGPSQIVCMIGANGAGKTTFLRAISGVQPIFGGRIIFGGRSIERTSAADRVALGIAQSPEGRQIFAPLSVSENLRLGAYTRTDSEIAADREKVFALFPVLAEKRHLLAGVLSGGQQQMLAIGRALMARPKLLLLDEPSMGLSPLLIDQIFAVIKALQSDGITIVLVEQNARAALSVSDYGYILETGRIARTGRAKDLLADPDLERAYLGT
jgi:branched-chain amino acid transport system ATP-binding protein